MNKSNVLEIKKLFKMVAGEVAAIDTVCTCLVNGEKKKLMTNTEAFSRLEDEEQFKYMDIFNKTLTGTIGKKLINCEFAPSTESLTCKDKMVNIYKHLKKDDSLRDELIDNIINNYAFGENFLIVIGSGVYDAPIKTSDGKALEDETEQYDFIIASICPMHSTKAGLTYDNNTGRMVSSQQTLIVQPPMNGFLYPAFNDRRTDEDGILFFTKKPEEQHSELIQAILGAEAPTSSAEQQNIFENIIAEVTDDKADFEIIKTLHENLQEVVEANKMSSSDKKLDKEDLKDLLSSAGIDKDKLDDFDHIYERASHGIDTDFNPQNLMVLDKFNVKAPDVEIKIKPSKTNLVRKEVIKGKNCIVVELDEGNIKLNGIQIKE